MNFGSSAAVAISTVFLSACGIEIIPNEPRTNASFATATSFGGLSSPPFWSNVDGSDIDGTHGYAYAVGLDDPGTGFYLYPDIRFDQNTNELIANAGILATTDYGAVPTSGIVVFSGDWEMAYVHAIYCTGITCEGTRGLDGGALNLSVDFGDGSLTSVGGTLTVEGTFTNGSDSWTGTVTYLGQLGDAQGVIGGSGATGVFIFESNDLVFPGGFNVN